MLLENYFLFQQSVSQELRSSPAATLMSGITSEAWRAVDLEGQEGITFTSFSPSRALLFLTSSIPAGVPEK